MGQRGPKAIPNKLGEPLSRAQLAVAALMREGLTNKEIGEKLFIHEKSVKFHTSGIFKKTGCKNRSEFIANYWKHKVSLINEVAHDVIELGNHLKPSGFTTALSLLEKQVGSRNE